jgi:hypothetical protein
VLGADWSNLTVAGAFIVGAVLGSIAMIRVTRMVLEYFQRYLYGRGSDEPTQRLTWMREKRQPKRDPPED